MLWLTDWDIARPDQNVTVNKAPSWVQRRSAIETCHLTGQSDEACRPRAKGSDIFLKLRHGRRGTIVEPEAARRLDDSVEGGADEAMKEPPATGYREIFDLRR